VLVAPTTAHKKGRKGMLFVIAFSAELCSANSKVLLQIMKEKVSIAQAAREDNAN